LKSKKESIIINLWTSPYIADPNFYHHDCLRQLGKTFGVQPMRAGKGTGEEGKCHVLMVLASWLFENQSWFRSLRGPKIIVEHDAYLNFMPESPFYKCWTRLYRTCNFHLLISSGKKTTEKLREEGIPTVWVPKGCNKEFLDVENSFSGRMGFFGKPIAEQETDKQFYFYKSRYEMSGLVEGNLPMIACQAIEFPKTIAGYSACLTNDATMGEPMAKQFEVSALGAAVIREQQDELLDLGFVNHESVIMYNSWDEMMELCQYYVREDTRAMLESIQRKAKEVARQHTWEHRAKEVYQEVQPFIKEKIYV
jgi:hypothetical protein